VEQNTTADLTKPAPSGNARGRNAGRWKLLAVLFVCAAPLIAAYLAYYVIKPTSRNNYGTLIDPRAFPIPAMASTTLDGRAETLDKYKGKWVLLKVGGGNCAQACQEQLFEMRQLRLMQGKEMDRIERVWLVTDDQPLDTIVIREFDGTHMLRAPGEAVRAWLPADAGTTEEEHIYVIDPLGNLMMSFPKDPDRPQARKKMYKDIAKLLKASAIG
jgi:cytochrome oxidase Cu insertion factor (SCO1/SenC/PrrC family)